MRLELFRFRFAKRTVDHESREAILLGRRSKAAHVALDTTGMQRNRTGKSIGVTVDCCHRFIAGRNSSGCFFFELIRRFLIDAHRFRVHRDTASDGTYVITLPIGSYRITLDGKDVPPKYRNVEESPLKYEVALGDDLFNINLDDSPKALPSTNR